MNPSVVWPFIFLLCVGCSASGSDAAGPEGGSLDCAAPLDKRDVTLDPDEVREAVEANDQVLRMCYERSQELNPGLQGKVDVNLFVSAAGTPTHVCSSGATIRDRRVVECVLHVFSQFRFAKRDEATASIFPVVFSPD